MKTTKKTALLGIATVTALALLLGAGSENAATKRDVIADAQAICNAAPTDPNIQAACTLVFKTNGWQILGNGCNTMFDGTDNGVVDYLLRNCDTNEGALLRKASSAVLSLYDYIVKKKHDQGCVAVGYLNTYHDNYLLLQSTGKLVAAPGVDLAEGCGGEPASLLRGALVVESIGGTPALTDAKPTVVFGDDGSVSGHASCNGYSGSYALTGEGLTVSGLLSTMKACPPPLMQQEDAFLAILREVMRFERPPDGTLVLHGVSGRWIRAARSE